MTILSLSKQPSVEDSAGCDRCQMTTKIRQPGASYPQPLLEEARKVFRGGGGCAVEFAELHSVKRTTALGWKRKAEGKIPLRRKGAPRKFGRFEEAAFLKEMLGKDTFQTPETITIYAQKLGVRLAKRTVQRMLARWGILADDCRIPDRGERGTVLLLWRRDWSQPDDSVDSGKQPVRGVLWLLASRKGLKGFMLTDDSDKALSLVVSALKTTMKPRHRLFTNCLNLVRAAAVKYPRLSVTVKDG